MGSFRISIYMDKFDEAVEHYLDPIDEGIISRMGQRVKNVGRTFTQPFKKMGSGEDARVAVSFNSKGYKKTQMLREILTSAVNDLQKLGAVKTSHPANDIALAVVQYLDNAGVLELTDADLSALGLEISRSIPTP